MNPNSSRALYRVSCTLYSLMQARDSPRSGLTLISMVVDVFWCSDWLITMFLFSRIQEEIADYISSLDQGLAVLTNSTVVEGM